LDYTLPCHARQRERHGKNRREKQSDVGGYGISWSDSIDLSESELWLNGKAMG
jgi:hypothetical protein